MILIRLTRPHQVDHLAAVVCVLYILNTEHTLDIAVCTTIAFVCPIVIMCFPSRNAKFTKFTVSISETA